MHPKLQPFGVVLLAGGHGTRMKVDTPKQMLQLCGRPLIEHSLNVLASIPEVSEISIVLASEYRNLIELPKQVPVRFAEPGARRQDSVYNGLQSLSAECLWICVHDAARPCVTLESIRSVLAAAQKHGAAVLGVPVKDTIKQADSSGNVLRSIPRESLWKVHTPQVLHRDLLEQGFEQARLHGTNVTDDVSLVESLDVKVKLVRDEETNLKVTTPDDLIQAERILEQKLLTGSRA